MSHRSKGRRTTEEMLFRSGGLTGSESKSMVALCVAQEMRMPLSPGVQVQIQIQGYCHRLSFKINVYAAGMLSEDRLVSNHIVLLAGVPGMFSAHLQG